MSSTVAAVGPSMQQRMKTMASRDRVWGTGFTVVLWAVYAFVFYQITGIVESASIVATLTVGAALVLTFVTASVIAMLSQYARYLEQTYEPDIRHLDEKHERDQRR